MTKLTTAALLLRAEQASQAVQKEQHDHLI